MPDLPTREPEVVVKLRNGAVKLTRRAEPNAQAAINGHLIDGDTIRYRRPIEGQDIGSGRGALWYPVFVTGGTRWDYVHSHYIELPECTETPLPLPDTDTEPALDPLIRAYIDARITEAETRIKTHTEMRLDQVIAALNQQWKQLAWKLVNAIAPYIGLQVADNIEWIKSDKQEDAA